MPNRAAQRYLTRISVGKLGIMDFTRWAQLMACCLCCGCAVTEAVIHGGHPLHPQHVDLVEVSPGGSEIKYSFFARARVNRRESADNAGGLQQALGRTFYGPACSVRDGTIDLLPAFPGCRAVRVLVPQGLLYVPGVEQPLPPSREVGRDTDERELPLLGSTPLHQGEPLESLQSYRVKLSHCEAVAYIEVPRPGTTDLVLVSHASEIARVSVDDAGEFDPSLIPLLPLSLLFDVVTLPVQVVMIVWWFHTFGN